MWAVATDLASHKNIHGEQEQNTCRLITSVNLPHPTGRQKKRGFFNQDSIMESLLVTHTGQCPPFLEKHRSETKKKPIEKSMQSSSFKEENKILNL